MNGDVMKDTDRGELEKDTDRGQRAKDTDRGFTGAGDSTRIASDIFQRASQLGGLLVVAIVAPIGPSAGTTNGSSSTQRALLGIAEAARKKLPKPGVPEGGVEKVRGQLERKLMISGGD